MSAIVNNAYKTEKDKVLINNPNCLLVWYYDSVDTTVNPNVKTRKRMENTTSYKFVENGFIVKDNQGNIVSIVEILNDFNVKPT